jgi:adenylate cyclase
MPDPVKRGERPIVATIDQPLENAAAAPPQDESRFALVEAPSADADDGDSNERRVRRLIAQLGGWRLALTAIMLLFALLIARFGNSLPMIEDAENALYDMRATITAAPVAQDQRIAMVTYNDEVLSQLRVRSPLDRALLAEALATLDTMGATSIGIDILFDSATDDDDRLRAQLRSMRTPTFIGFAEPASNPNNIQAQQAAFLRSFIASIGSPNVRAASIRLENDADDVIRHWPGRAPGSPTLMTVAMANAAGLNAAAFEQHSGGIRWRMPARVDTSNGVDTTDVFANMPITIFTDPAIMTPETRPIFAEQIRGRHILIGGDVIDTDEFTTPLSSLPDLATGESKPMIGLEVHAHLLAQILDNARLAAPPGWALWLAALMIIAAGVATALLDMRPWLSAIFLLAQMAMIGAIPVMLQNYGVDTLTMPVAGAAVGWLLAFIATTSAGRAVGAEERAFAQGALGKYLPRDIAQQILRDPDRLALRGEKRAIYCLFSDLEGFTQMSHAMTPEQVAFVLNAYLDTLSETILAHGGTIDKFVGDAVVAFWGAPIARADDAQQAGRAMLAMAEAGEAFRVRMRSAMGGTLPPIGRTRVGVHFGEAVVGNFGGEGRMQYTALGDSMNTAARLESANKPMMTRALISAEAAEHAGLDVLVPMGTITLRGRAQPVTVFEPRPDLDGKQRAIITDLVAAHAHAKDARFDAAVMAAAGAFPDDASVRQLLRRLHAAEPGAAFTIS